jgi:hypothetical protein
MHEVFVEGGLIRKLWSVETDAGPPFRAPRKASSQKNAPGSDRTAVTGPVSRPLGSNAALWRRWPAIGASDHGIVSSGKRQPDFG